MENIVVKPTNFNAFYDTSFPLINSYFLDIIYNTITYLTHSKILRRHIAKLSKFKPISFLNTERTHF
jgi:hypothetical protein